MHNPRHPPKNPTPLRFVQTTVFGNARLEPFCSNSPISWRKQALSVPLTWNGGFPLLNTTPSGDIRYNSWCAEVYRVWSKSPTERALSKKAVMTQNLTKNGLFIQSEAEWDFLGGCLGLCI